MDKPLRFHRLADAEVTEAARWYRRRDRQLAVDFREELNRALELIALKPELFAKWLKGTRRYLLKRFPYSVVYFETPTEWVVVAVAHAKRRPGYWQKRLPRK